MNARTKQHRQWAKELKEWWVERGYPRYCELGFEGCMGTFGLALCHSKKRRFIYTKEDYWEVCAGCVKCHEVLDLKMSHEDMERTVREVIARRGCLGL